MLNGAIRHTPEVDRIITLPRRDLGSHEWDHLVDEMTELLRRSTGNPRACLRRVQALALYEIAANEGGFCSVEVGGGKTLISLLCAFGIEAERVLLLTKGGLVHKTNRERLELERDWLIPSHVRLFSYDMLGQEQWAAELEAFAPDLIIGDEIQCLGNPESARTRRVTRYMQAHPQTRFVALSGTIMSKSLLEFGHILRWCLKDNAPVPACDSELSEWAAAIDADVVELKRYDVGALLDLADAMGVPKGGDDLARAREGFRRRLVETPGVVTSDGRSAEHVGASIYIRAIDNYPVAPSTLDHFATLRDEMLMPDGRELLEGTEVWRHARELALGMVYVWNPWPPDDWRLARRAWFSFVRAVISNSEDLDSPAQVTTAVDEGRLPSGRPILAKWREIEPSFTPNVEPRWYDDGPLRTCLKWMKERSGLVWVEHTFFGRRLAELGGTKYYGQGGFANDGEFVDDAPNKRSIVLSADANKEGRNLQFKWSRNLIVSPVESAKWWQQLIGRTHRTKQRDDEVEVDVFLGCREHAKAWRQARHAARAVFETTGEVQKLLIADVDDAWPSEDDLARRRDARWRLPSKKAFRIPTEVRA